MISLPCGRFQTALHEVAWKVAATVRTHRVDLPPAWNVTPRTAAASFFVEFATCRTYIGPNLADRTPFALDLNPHAFAPSGIDVDELPEFLRGLKIVIHSARPAVYVTWEGEIVNPPENSRRGHRFTCVEDYPLHMDDYEFIRHWACELRSDVFHAA